jgi:flagellar hook protein FlgE
MTITSSMNAGIATLNVNSTRLGVIADNIANASTDGFKRGDVDFKAMVNARPTDTVYSAGGVRAITRRAISELGAIEATTNPTDLAVLGRGFLPVGMPGPDIANPTVRLMTSASFNADKDGYLRNASGHLLMGWPALANGTVPAYARQSLVDLKPVRVDFNQFVANPTTEINLSYNLPATATQAGAPGEALTSAITYYGNLGSTERLTMTFTPEVPQAGGSNTWRLDIADSASADAIVGSYTLVFANDQGGGGRLASITAIGASPAYDFAEGTTELTVGGGTIRLSLGRDGAVEGLTQLADNFVPVSIRRDGSPVGILNAVEVDGAGNLFAISTEGSRRLIYQVPLLDVPNPNALIAHSDQTYELSRDAGNFFLWTAGQGPTGRIAGFSREQSNADIAQELTHLIRTQRAYSTGAKVVQTADEMLQETNNIKR